MGRLSRRVLVPLHPAIGNRADGLGIEEMNLLPTASLGADEMGRLKDRKMLGDRLAGQRQAGAELTKALAVSLVQAVQQPAPGRIGQRLEHVVHRRHCRITSGPTAARRRYAPTGLPSTGQAAFFAVFAVFWHGAPDVLLAQALRRVPNP